MQGQANVKLQQNFELAEVTCKKCLYNTITKTVQYEVPVLAFLFQKLPTKSSSLSVEKIIKPSIYASELRDRLLLDGVVDADELPSASQINKRMRRDLVMSKKKLLVIPSESNTPEQIARQDEYLNVISTFKPH